MAKDNNDGSPLFDQSNFDWEKAEQEERRQKIEDARRESQIQLEGALAHILPDGPPKLSDWDKRYYRERGDDYGSLELNLLGESDFAIEFRAAGRCIGILNLDGWLVLTPALAKIFIHHQRLVYRTFSALAQVCSDPQEYAKGGWIPWDKVPSSNIGGQYEYRQWKRAATTFAILAADRLENPTHNPILGDSRGIGVVPGKPDTRVIAVSGWLASACASAEKFYYLPALRLLAKASWSPDGKQ